MQGVVHGAAACEGPAGRPGLFECRIAHARAQRGQVVVVVRGTRHECVQPAAALGFQQRAVRLLAAAGALLEAKGSGWLHAFVPRAPYDDDDLATMRSRMGDAAFEQAWAYGRSLAGSRAVEYALHDQPPDPGRRTARTPLRVLVSRLRHHSKTTAAASTPGRFPAARLDRMQRKHGVERPGTTSQ